MRVFLIIALLLAGCSSAPGEPAAAPLPHAIADAETPTPDTVATDRGPPDTAPDSPPVPEGPTGTPDVPSPYHQIEVEVTADAWAELHADPQSHMEIPCVIWLDDVRYEEAEIELHGGYARTLPKKSYRLTVEDDEAVWWDLFGDGPERQRRMVLQASWIDPTFLRNKLTMDLQRAMGGMAPRASFAELTVNGDYLGFYVLLERIDKPYLKRQGLDTDAVVYKAENHSANWAAKDNPLDGFQIKLDTDPEAEPTELAALLWATTYTPLTFEAFEPEVASRLNLDDFMVWQLVHSFAMDRDAFTKNYYLYRARTPEARFRIISWDADATFGGDWDGRVLDPTESKAIHGWDSFSPRLLSIPEYRASYLDRFALALGGPLDAGPLVAHVDALAQHIRAGAIRDATAWQREIDFDAEITRLKAAIMARHTTMSQAISEALESDDTDEDTTP